MLFDTHALIWDFLTPNRLSQPALEALSVATSAGEVAIAAISLWEIAMLVEKRRVVVAVDCQTFIEAILQARQIKVIPLTPHIATRSVQLPDSVNKDPADRLIVATAIAENVPLVTADRNLRRANIVSTIW